MGGAIPPLPNTLSWHSAQLKKKHRDDFTFYLWCYQHQLVTAHIYHTKSQDHHTMGKEQLQEKSYFRNIQTIFKKMIFTNKKNNITIWQCIFFHHLFTRIICHK
jgi:hypothetical protein